MSHTRTTRHDAKAARSNRQAAQRRQNQQRRDAERLRDRYEADAQPREPEPARYKP